MSNKTLLDSSPQVSISTHECLHLLGAEYVGALLDGEKETAKRFGVLLLIFAQQEAAKRKTGHALDQWPGVLREVMTDVVSPLSDDSWAAVENDVLIRLDSSPFRNRHMARFADSSIAYGGAPSIDNFIDQLLRGNIIVSGEPIELTQQ